MVWGVTSQGKEKATCGARAWMDEVGEDGIQFSKILELYCKRLSLFGDNFRFKQSDTTLNLYYLSIPSTVKAMIV